MEKNYYTLITGASKGIGRAIAVECARRGMNLALISLPDENLKELSNELASKYKIKSRYKTIDLTDSKSPELIHKWCVENKLEINTLINNAGFGSQGSFENQTIGFYKQMINLNVRAIVLLTHAFIPDLKKNSPSYILNLGSIASFYPIPYKAVYSASKNFVFTFSRALREELHYFNISVSVLCPGPVITNYKVVKRARRQGIIGKWLTSSPQKVAVKAIKRMLNKNFIIIPGVFSKANFYAEKVTPMYIKQKLSARVFFKFSNKKK